MGRIHNLNRKVGRMGLLNLLYLTSMPTEHKNKYFVKCRYGKYFLCVSKGYKNAKKSSPFKSPDRALIVCSLYKLFDNKRLKLSNIWILQMK